MLELLSDPNAWASLLTLTALEIVLGIDNVIFLSIVSGRLPVAQQASARRIGLALALVMRIGLLASISWIMSLTRPAFTVVGFEASWRDIVLGLGGLFLLFKGTTEIHHMTEGHGGRGRRVVRGLGGFSLLFKGPTETPHMPGGRGGGGKPGPASFLGAVVQIVLLDIVFSPDSVTPAVGMADHLPVMIAAVVIA